MGTSKCNGQIEQVTCELDLTNHQLRELSEKFITEMELGLAKETHPTASVKMFPTFIRDIPDGTEYGKYLALDLGGTNFRVLSIEFNGIPGEEIIKSKVYEVPKRIMRGTGVELFDHIAQCLAFFCEEENMLGERLPLGFTFSFPCLQNGLTSATLVAWTKGFDVSGVVGEDVCVLLHEAVNRRSDIDIDVVAVVNDTVGTLLSCAYKNPTCAIGLILGTGSNACYMEQLDRVGTWKGDHNDPKQVIINMECGAFGDNGAIDFIRTQYDREVDEFSLNKGRQTFEKMISGMYMGELARLVLVRLTRDGLMFGGKGSDALFERDRFLTRFVSEIEEDKGATTNARVIAAELGLSGVATEDDYFYMHYVCRQVSRRSAFLSAATMATLLNRINKPHVTIAVDGSLYKNHPNFHNLMVEKIHELCNPGLKFDMMLSEDGSGRGAALAAAVAYRVTGRSSPLSQHSNNSTNGHAPTNGHATTNGSLI